MRCPSWIPAPLFGLFALVACARLPAQIPPGHVVATLQGAGLPRPQLAFVDPLQGATTLVGDPNNLLPGPLRSLLALTPAGEFVAAVGDPTTGIDVLVRGKILANAIAAVAAFANGLPGTVTCLAGLRGNGFAVGTTSGVFRVPLGGGTVSPVQGGVHCRDLAVTTTHLAALVTDPTTGAATLLLAPLQGGGPVSRPLPLLRPRALGWAEAANAFLIGTDSGEVHALDAATFVATLLAAPGRGPITTFVHATNHANAVFGTPGSLQTLDGNAVGPVLPLPANSFAAELDWMPFTSTFRLEESGCPGSAGIPVLGSAGGAPFPGNARFSVTLTNALPASTAYLVVGGDRLLLDLATFGAPGCRLLTTPVVTVPAATGTQGRALVGMPVPPSAALAGGALSVQWLVIDPVNALGLVASARGRAEL